MENSPKVSLIVPVYNGREYVQRCFGSIVRQTFRDFEVIVVDDCSDDSSLECIRDFWPKDAPPCLLMRNERNLGPSLSRNRGIEAARGKYIGFVDSDDAIHPEYLATLYGLAEEGNDYAACGTRKVFQNGTSAPYAGNELSCRGWREILDYIEKRTFNLATCGSLMRGSIVRERGIRFAKGAYEDVFFNFRVLMYCRSAIAVGDMLYDYYDREGSLSKSDTGGNCDYVEAFCTILPLVEGFLSVAGKEIGMSRADAMRARKFFLRLALQRIRTTAKRVGEERYGEWMERELKKHFGEGAASLYLSTIAELYRDNSDMEQIGKLSYQLQQREAQIALYEDILPALKVLQRKKAMMEGILSVAEASLELFPEQEWYGEYWRLVGKTPEFPGMEKWLAHFKRKTVEWMEGKTPVQQQFGALALLLCAPLDEVRPYIRGELWPDRLLADLRVLESWESLQK